MIIGYVERKAHNWLKLISLKRTLGVRFLLVAPQQKATLSESIVMVMVMVMVIVTVRSSSTDGEIKIHLNLAGKVSSQTDHNANIAASC